MEWWEYLLYGAAVVGGWVLSYWVRPRVTEKLALQKELLADYLVPYKKWCRSLYKELTEFKERYPNEEVYRKLSKTLIIIDYRELHDVLREAGKYRGKMERDNPSAAIFLKGLESLVDNLWHGLQDDFSINFDQSEHDTWMAAVIEYPKKAELIESIRTKSHGVLHHLNLKKDEEYKNLKKYLEDQCPN